MSTPPLDTATYRHSLIAHSVTSVWTPYKAYQQRPTRSSPHLLLLARHPHRRSSGANALTLLASTHAATTAAATSGAGGAADEADADPATTTAADSVGAGGDGGADESAYVGGVYAGPGMRGMGALGWD
ncbi:hypothetical protein V496_02075 [Pseudogymnoascus sp. VKM F-4515 (FW-2607)]|nr:hypothetical protein V496_02075 [Pseudogymnoascus sp. VKM F-4515 (FW-2607)]